MTPREKFIRLIRDDILRLGDATLDFGIYRILNFRRAVITRYLEETLPALVSAQLARLPGAEASEETRIYAALTDFFSRYYEDGDFVMKARRGREAAYSVPYNGEDVHFHWATKGSHYVKSGLYFDTYAVKLAHKGGDTLTLAVDRAELPKDNNKAKDKRYFVPSAYAAEGNTHRVTFQWRALDAKEAKKYEGKTAQDAIIEAWLTGRDFKYANLPAAILGGFPESRSNADVSGPVTLAEHVRRFTAKHNADFFVHPQLRQFLEGELDWFLKNEFLAIWDKDADGLVREREKFKIAKSIGESLIAFLGEIEDVQAALFEKRRFVTKTDYLVMASRAPDALREAACANPAQVAEWAWWVGENKSYDPLKPSSGKSHTAKLGKDLLKRFPHLPIHTRHFDDAFTLELLSGFDDMEAACGGLLVHSENYGALRTLEPTYRGQVKCIYIDPPYNTGKDEFAYKDEYPDSTWGTLMLNRLTLASRHLRSDGVLVQSIDHNERVVLGNLLDGVFGKNNRLGEIVWQNVTDNNPTQIANEHEYLLVSAKNVSSLPNEWKSRRVPARDMLIRVGNELLARHKKLEALSTAYQEWFAANKQYLGKLAGYSFIDQGGVYAGSRSVHNPGKEGYRYDLLHPTTRRKCKMPLMGYRFPYETMQKLLDEKRIIFGEDETKLIELKVYAHEYEDKLSSVLVLDGRSGANEFRSLFTAAQRFSNPKPPGLLTEIFPFMLGTAESVFDFFAGSGTTGHAVMNLNREDGGTRRFMLVEMGEYFDSVLLPRIAKVMTSPDWKDGAPRDTVQHVANDDDHWSARTLPMVKVLRLEGYEDSLNAIELPDDGTDGGKAEGKAGEVFASATGDRDGDDIRYVLREAKNAGDAPQPVFVNAMAFDHPFDYHLHASVAGERQTLTIDLAETTCLMLGLVATRIREATRKVGNGKAATVQRARLIEGRLVQEGQSAESAERALIILRDVIEAVPASGRDEYDWIESEVQSQLGRALASYTTVFFNGDMSFFGEENAQALDGIVKRVMTERAG
ncbi:MAG: site-specific DNA-methyltransferase [Burkholderiales bacterium]|jgi:adenine-specific DNA-methyltransferase